MQDNGLLYIGVGPVLFTYFWWPMQYLQSFIGSRGFLRRVLLVVGYPYDKIQKHSETYTNLRNHTIKFALIQLLLFGYLGFRVWVVQDPSIPKF